MKQLFKQNAVFITLSLILFVALGLAIVSIPKGELHLLLCDHHTPARDIFYRYYTRIAEYMPYLICVLILFFGRLGNAAMSAAAVAGAELTTQTLKHIFNAPRPVTWFAEHMPDVQLPLVEGVRMNHWYSFPSGHTTTFFALFLVLSILASKRLMPTKRVALQVALFLLAATGGYSRIYLCQHFAADVMAGIGVGVSISFVIAMLFARYEKRRWYNYRILKNKRVKRKG